MQFQKLSVLTAALTLGLTPLAYGTTIISVGATDDPSATTVNQDVLLGSDYPTTATASNVTASADVAITGHGTVPTFRLYGSIRQQDISDSVPPPSTVLRSKIAELAPGDRFGILHSTVANSSTTGYAMVLFEQANWSALNSGPVSFDSTSTLFVDFPAIQGSNVNNLAFVVRSGGTYYQSGNLSQLGGTQTSTTISDAAAAEWFAFDPTQDLFGDVAMNPTAGTGVLGSTLTEIDGVGWMTRFTRNSSQAGEFTIEARLFNVTAVPEPASLALLGLGGLLMLGRSRKARG